MSLEIHFRFLIVVIFSFRSFFLLLPDPPPTSCDGDGQKLDGATKKHAQQNDDSPCSIQVPTTISVIGGVQQRLGPTSSTLNSGTNARPSDSSRRTSELKSHEQPRNSTDSDVRLNAVRSTHRTSTYDQQSQLNDSNSNRSESLQSVESALQLDHRQTTTTTHPQSTNHSNQPDHVSSAARLAKQPTKDTTTSNQSHKDTFKSKTDTNPILELAAQFAASNRQRKQSISGGYLHHRRSVAGASGRLSVADIATAAQQSTGSSSGLLKRRRAVEISDHKAVVLLHSKLKGMKLEDIA